MQVLLWAYTSLLLLLLQSAGMMLDEQVISYRPLIIVVPNFATAEECEGVLERMNGCHRSDWKECQEIRSRLATKAQTSSAQANNSKPLRNSTSFQLTLAGEIDPAIDPLVRRAHVLARHPITAGEGVQVASYHEGDYYGFHHDSLQRRATLLLYLTDVAEGLGGETIFPLIRAPGIGQDVEPPLPPAVVGGHRETTGSFKVSKMEDMIPYCESDYYLKVRPEAGKAILFFSFTPDMTMDEYAIHGACPIRHGGHKAIFQRWMRFEKNMLFEKAEESIRTCRTDLGKDILLPPGIPPNSSTTPHPAEASAASQRWRARIAEAAPNSSLRRGYSSLRGNTSTADAEGSASEHEGDTPPWEL
eukprot:gnl/TRDRNA2_/TRDRNA2_131280_c0_seq1.p1 gnl/TRDRNA2_/TRDRNA2_131280_c0~~gnl/TRDRNA2_/TRDRNA2_131280_c0_seq1.p1  ORF type:complete len:360 (+),score=60.10 gnl/TRDRNA2_/TRDRNA2_131280_c0_seq1:38-1117(+)